MGQIIWNIPSTSTMEAPCWLICFSKKTQKNKKHSMIWFDINLISYIYCFWISHWISVTRSATFLATNFTRKMPESLDFMYSFTFILENIRYLNFTEKDLIHKKLWIVLQFSSGPQGPIIRTKFTISRKFEQLQVKLCYHVFPSMKVERYMESELSGIFHE